MADPEHRLCVGLGVVEAFDVIKLVRSCAGLDQIAFTFDAVPFDHAEEAIGRCVVSAVADGAHAAEDVVIGEESLIVPAGKLRTAVRVQHQ